MGSHGVSPGESPAPSIAFPTAAGWVPALPAELREPPPMRLTASGVFRPVADERVPQDRRFQERRIRDDGSPYGHERRAGSDVRTSERRLVDGAPSRDSRSSGVRMPPRHETDYAPHHSDLLARLHGR